MEEMMVPEPQILESNSEVDQLGDAGQSNDVQSSENLVPNISSDVASTDDVSTAAMGTSPSETSTNNILENCSEGANLDQVSSSTESFSGSCRDALPSVNHQTIAIPNMEPYLEDGSLDGTSKDLQDPTSTNGNLNVEDCSNPDPTSNHVEPDLSLQENNDRQLDSNLNSNIYHEETMNTDEMEPTLDDRTASDQDQAASCSNQLMEESASAVYDAVVTETEEEHQVPSEPFTSEEPELASTNSNVELGNVDVEPGVGEAEPVAEFEGAGSSRDHFVAEADVVDGDHMVSSLTQAEEAQSGEPDGLVDCTVANEGNGEIPTTHGEETPEPACQLLEANEGIGNDALMGNDYVDSSTLQMEDQEFVPTEPDGSLMEQENSNNMPMQGEEANGSLTAEASQLGNSNSVSEIDTVDSSVDHMIHRVDHAAAGGSADIGSIDEECVPGEPVESEQVDRVDTEQVDSGAFGEDQVAEGSSNAEFLDRESMETGHVDSRTVGNETGIIEPEPIEGVTENEPVESISLENPPESAYNNPLEGGCEEAHPLESQPVAEEEARPIDEVVDSSYYMDSVNLEQPDGTLAQEAEAASGLEESLPTPSQLNQNYQCNEASNSELLSMETAMSNPTAVCEADSSAAGIEDSAYETQQMVDTQNVYVVEENGQLTLNSVQQSNPIASYHNADNAMLVEMAPLPTDGSYVNSQVSYVDAGQEGMITDAQAAELLMRVSEQRPMSIQSLQQDSSASSGPYVQVQLAQTVEGITHLVEVPVSALAGYCLPSTLVYSTSGAGNSSSTGSEMTWVQMHETSAGGIEQHHLRSENKFSDIVSASIEAIGFPESSTPGANILSQAEQILIASENAAQESATAAASNFDFDESSNSSITLVNDKATTSYPRPKRESIESRIHRLLRGANAPAPEVVEEPMPVINRTTSKNVKLAPLQSPKQSDPPSTSSTVTLSLNANQPKRPNRLVTATTSMGRTVTIPTVFTATNQSANRPINALPPGSVDYFMPRGVSKRKAQNFKISKVASLNPNSIDVEPAPPEETQVKLAMGSDTVEDEDIHKEDDEFNRAVLLQARQRLQSEQEFNHGSRFRSSTSIHLSLPAADLKSKEEMTPAKRVRLSFPPEKYANLESVSPAYMTELQTPKLTYTIPRTRQPRPKIIKEVAGIDNPVKQESEISVRLPWMEEEDDLKRKRMPPRIIRQTVHQESKPKDTDVSAFDIDPETEQSDEIIVIGLDETGQQPSEEQLTAIIQAAMTKRDSTVPERKAPMHPARSVHSTGTNTNTTAKTYPSKRKVEDENGLDVDENGVRPKVIRTYDRLGTPKKKQPRAKKLANFLEIFEFEDDEEEDEEEVDDLERFSQALADEEKAIREKEKLLQSRKPQITSANNVTGSSVTYSRGRGRGRGRGNVRQTHETPAATITATVKEARSRGRPPRTTTTTNKLTSKPKSVSDIKGNNDATAKKVSSDDDSVACKKYTNDDGCKVAPRGRGRGRGRGKSRSRGRRGRPRTVSREETMEVEEEEVEEEEEEEELRIPGMPSKPCPQCEERFTTREGFLDHVIVHSSAKCLLEQCDWTNPVPKDKARLKQHMLNAHTESIPTARSTNAP